MQVRLSGMHSLKQAAIHPQAFKSAMKDLAKASKKAFDKMNQLEPKVWIKAYFETHCKTDNTENNISECFNSWILISSNLQFTTWDLSLKKRRKHTRRFYLCLRRYG
ncbi:hypothetical protein AgCh_003924 [Apium graveolens]